MRYPTLKAHTPSTGRLAFLSAAALVAFTMASSIVGSNQLFASSSERYSVRASAMRLQRSLLLQVVIEDNETQGVISAPRVTLTLPPALRSSDAGARMASMNSSAAGVDIAVQTRPDGDNQIVDVTIQKDGQTIQQNTLRVIPTVDETAHDAKRFTGHPISMDLKDADIRDVIRTFGKLTGLTMQIDDSVQGKVTVTWQNVPWDKAFDSLLSENGLTYTIDGKTVHVSKK